MNIRLLVDAHVFDGEFQGTRTFIEGIYNIIAHKKNVELYLAANDIPNLKLHFPTAKNIHYVELKSDSSVRRLVYEFPSIIRKYEIEYAHFQYIPPPIKLCKYIVTTHDVIFNEYPEEFSTAYRTIKNFLYKKGAQRADIITTVSEYSKKSIEKYLDIESDKIHVIPNGVSPQYLLTYNKFQAKQYIRTKFGFDKYILFVSRIEPRKNHILLLNAFLDLELHLKGYRLVFLGNKTLKTSPFESALEELSPDLRRFIFLSSEVNNKDLLGFYRAADLFVYPSKAEGFGIPPLEAAALGIPVICSNTSAMSDFSFFGENHIDPNDYDAFRKRIMAVLQNAENHVVLNEVANIVKEKYNWEHSAETLYSLIIHDKALVLPAK